MKIWNPQRECASRRQIEEWQLEALKNTVKRMWENVAPYRKKMEEVGVRPEHIKTLKDLSL